MKTRLAIATALFLAATIVIVARLPEKLDDNTVLGPVEFASSRAALVAPSAAGPAPATPAPEDQSVQKLIADTQSSDAAVRATAISGLAEAPRSDALPVLGHILTDGEPQIDRPLAARALRDLALNQGDGDGAIRDAVRHAIYHGDDQTNVSEIQETLDVIEESQQPQ